MIDDVDVKVAEVASAGPDEAVESLYLVHQVADAFRLWGRGEETDGSMHPVATLEDLVADFSVLESFDQLLERAAVT